MPFAGQKFGSVQQLTITNTAGSVLGIKTKKRSAFFGLVLLAALCSAFVSSRWLLQCSRTHNLKLSPPVDPADVWRDDVYPLRPSEPWDISTSFPHPRKLEYDVRSGTWLRLDVHPRSGEVVFDMAGDLYCLAINTDEGFAGVGDEGTVKARPILLGVPHDSDPRFSPDGKRIVFRSDAGLGVENIWVTEWRGCEAMDLRPDNEDARSFELARALENRGKDEELLNQGTEETPERKHRRLILEGRAEAQRVTNETYRWVSDARFNSAGTKVIATKRYFSERSLGAGEGWEYELPSSHLSARPDTIESGSGKRIVGRILPPGWAPERYNDQQIGPEQFVWRGKDSLVYSKNVIDQSTFDYSKDVHKGINAIFSLNLTTGITETLVDAFPGGASRPELSRDGRTLAFVRRVRDREALVFKDLETGTIHHIWHGLTYDLSTIYAPMGTYPSFAFTPSDNSVVIWSSGQIYIVPLSTNLRGEKVAHLEQSPYAIPFKARIEKRLAETLSGGMDLVKEESKPTQQARSLMGLRADDDGNRVVFQSAGRTYIQHLSNPAKGASLSTTYKKNYPERIPHLHPGAPYHSPTFIYGSPNLVLHARWSDVNFTTFEIADLTLGKSYEIAGLPLGRYREGVLCECGSLGRQIAFVKDGGDWLTGDVVATAKPGLYIGSITLPSSGFASNLAGQKLEIRDLKFVPSEIDTGDRVQMRFIEKNRKLLVQQSRRSFVIDFTQPRTKGGQEGYRHSTLATGKTSSEIVVAPKMAHKHPHNFGVLSSEFFKVFQRKPSNIRYEAKNVAFVDGNHVYMAPGRSVTGGKAVWGQKPANATRGLVRLSLDGGHDITWSQDGKKLSWFLGPFLHSLEVSKIRGCEDQIKRDKLTFGISCVTNLVEIQELVVEFPTEITRLKRAAAQTHQNPNVTDGADIMFVKNANILTMDNGEHVIRNGSLISRGGIIEAVGELTVPDPSTFVIDAQGGFVVPGFIDAHAHWNGFDTKYPANSWELETFLAYGVTTLHNPSASNVGAFDESYRVESGQLIGPRIFTVGAIIYGAMLPDKYQDIASSDEARSALLRLKAEGGPRSISYKNYNLPMRASRQRLLLEARKLSMSCVPEGGMNWDWDLTYIIDGMTTVEHALPVPVLYEDILTLFAKSGTAYTPTHLVNYGGAFGEQYVWAHKDVPNDPKLRAFTRHDILEGLTESTARPSSSYALLNTSASVAKMVDQGLTTLIGAHGEPPIGYNYHSEMRFAAVGGLSTFEVIRAATISAASTLGLDTSIGSLTAGKLADFIIYPPGYDLLADGLSRSRDLRYVVKGGRVWDASTMAEVWPVKGRKQRTPPINPE